jgi:hypothetical protein
MRIAQGVARERERGLVAGALGLTGMFLLALPFIAARVALAVQLQVSRVFWLLDFFAALYLVWMAVEAGRLRTGGRPVRRWVTVLVAIAAMSRGGYIMGVEQRGRPIVQARAPEDEWSDVMRWVRGTDERTHILADPDHAFRYGTSVRVLGERDVFLENSKDTALATYSRDVAHRVLERIRAIGDFGALGPERAQALAARYDLDYLITERPMSLPRVYANGRFNVYALQNRDRATTSADRER